MLLEPYNFNEVVGSANAANMAAEPTNAERDRKRQTKSQDAVNKQLARVAEWGACPETREAVKQAAHRIAKGMKENAGGWWPGLHRSQDQRLLKSRSMMLDEQTFDHGLRRFIRELARVQLIKETAADKCIEYIDDASYFGFLQLWNLAIAKDDNPAVYESKRRQLVQGELAKKFGFVGKNRAQDFRGHLLGFGSVGLVTGEVFENENEKVGIEFGLTGAVFYNCIFMPVTSHMPLDVVAVETDVTGQRERRAQ